ncbi:MAG TPA: methyltransferase domain-containing protein [Acidimicrobiales bacterium]
MPSGRALRKALVADLERRGAIRTVAVRRAFATVPRERFVPEVADQDGLERVYADAALVTRTSNRGMPLSSSSQPTIMAHMLEELDLAPGMRVLEIGTGSGYNAALLSTLVGRKGQVASIELEPDLAAKADSALAAGGYPVRVVVGDALDAVDGLAGRPYDRIIVTASSDHVPKAWRDALVDGGLIELPLRLPGSTEGEQAVVTLRREGDGLRSVAVVPGAFMNLRRPGEEDARPIGITNVSVNEFVDGKGRSIASVSGGGLARLRPSARRRLAGVLLTTPRVRRLATPGPPFTSIVAYVGMAQAPEGVIVRTMRAAEWGSFVAGAGVAARDGSGLALVVGQPQGRSSRVEIYGEGPGSELTQRALGELVRRWRRAGCPSLADCQFTVTYEGPPKVGPGANIAEHDGVFTTLQWPA